jgi:hypothetical protein
MSIITRYRGDTAEDKIVITDPSTGAVVDVTGHGFVMTVSANADRSGVIYSVTGTILDALGGLVEFAPTALQADQLPGTYYYSVTVTYPSGRFHTAVVDKYVYK